MRRRSNDAELVLGGEPRVDLLPPEVELVKKARAQRRILVLLVVLAIAVVGAGYGLATIRAGAAQLGLLAAQERTLALIDEQAQYAEASAATRLLATIEATRSQATSTEIVWADVFDAITEVLPPNTYAAWNATSRLPWEPELTASGPLREPRVGTLILVITSAQPIEATTLVRALDDLDGFADASLDILERVSDDGAYQTTVTLNLGVDALAGRFPASEASE